MRYVTFNTAGELTGCYLQDVPAEHRAAHSAITEAQALNWPSLRMNAALNGVEIAPVPAYDLPASRVAFVTKVTSDADAVYADAVGNRGPEYQDALADANAFKATGYTTPVPQSVTDWSRISGLTLRGAAEDVIATAARLKSAQASLRPARLAAKTEAKAAVTQAALDTIKATWAANLAAIRASLGL